MGSRSRSRERRPARDEDEPHQHGGSRKRSRSPAAAAGSPGREPLGSSRQHKSARRSRSRSDGRDGEQQRHARREGDVAAPQQRSNRRSRSRDRRRRSHSRDKEEQRHRSSGREEQRQRSREPEQLHRSSGRDDAEQQLHHSSREREQLHHSSSGREEQRQHSSRELAQQHRSSGAREDAEQQQRSSRRDDDVRQRSSGRGDAEQRGSARELDRHDSRSERDSRHRPDGRRGGGAAGEPSPHEQPRLEERQRESRPGAEQAGARSRDAGEGERSARDRSRERSTRHRSRERSTRDRSRERDRDKARDGDRDRERDRERDRDKVRQRSSRQRSRERSRHRSRERSRERVAGRDRSSRWKQQQQPPQQQQQQQHVSRWDPPGAGGAAAAAALQGALAGGAAFAFPPPPPEPGSSYRGRPPAGPVSEEPPAVGSIHAGVVQTIKPFGVFVAIDGFRKHVLVHHSQVSEEVMLTRSDEDDLKVKALEYAAAPGQRVWVKVLEVSPDQGGGGFRLHGSMRVVDQASGADLDPSGQLAAQRGPGGGGGRLSDEPPELNSIHRGEVKRIEAYGVFVALQGFRKYGLVHASQVANYLEFSAEDGEAERKKALGEVVELGQDVWVKVVEVEEDERGRGPKIGCSLKLVDQADGTDLDPTNTRYRPRGAGGGAGGPGGRAPIGASAGEVRGGAIDWGYLATRPDAFGSKGYELLADEPAPPPAGPPPGARGGAGGGFPPPPGMHGAPPGMHAPPQQRLPPVGRGRGAVVPAWMTQGSGGAAAAAAAAPPAPGSVPHRPAPGEDGAGPPLTVEEALRIVQQAAASGKHKRSRHKKHKRSSHKKSSKGSRKDKGERRRSRSRIRSHSRSGSGGSSSGDERGR